MTSVLECTADDHIWLVIGGIFHVDEVEKVQEGTPCQCGAVIA